MLKYNLLVLLFTAPFSLPLSQKYPPPSSATQPQRTITLTTPNEIVQNYPRAQYLQTQEGEECKLITAKHPNLTIRSKVLEDSIGERKTEATDGARNHDRLATAIEGAARCETILMPVRFFREQAFYACLWRDAHILVVVLTQ